MTTISDLILTGDINVSELSSDLAGLGLSLFAPCLIFAALWEQLTSMRFDALLKRTVLAFVISASGVGILKSGVAMSLDISDQIISKYASRSMFLSLFDKDTMLGSAPKKERKLKDEDFDKYIIRKTGANHDSVSTESGGLTWAKLVDSSGDFLNSLYAELLFILAYFGLWLVGLIYTVIYSLLLVFIPFLASISLFPPLNKALEGIVISSVWCILTPIICAGVLCILEQSTSIGTNEGGVPVLSTLEMMVQFLGLTLVVLYVPMLVSAIIAGKGVSAIGDSLGNTAAMAGLTTGQGVIMSKASRAYGLGMGIGRSVFNGGLSYLNRPHVPTNNPVSDLSKFISKSKFSHREPVQFGINNKMPEQKATKLDALDSLKRSSNSKKVPSSAISSTPLKNFRAAPESYSNAEVAMKSYAVRSQQEIKRFKGAPIGQEILNGRVRFNDNPAVTKKWKYNSRDTSREPVQPMNHNRNKQDYRAIRKRPINSKLNAKTSHQRSTYV